MSTVFLNDAQQAAVSAPDGPALVLAGAGSGKTRVIIERMAWLVEERRVPPHQLLALTFTNKAAAEMRARLERRLGAGNTGAFLGTFHSFALFVLRREMDRLGRSRSFTIFDDGDQLSLMKRLVRELPPGFTPVLPRAALSWISRFKQKVETPRDENDTPDPAHAKSFLRLWDAYHDALEAASAVDFDDMLSLLVRLLEDHPDAREKYQRRYRHVLIDEYQDTNRAQYLIARRLAEAHGNLFAVGDEDQSIYSWRGADINNILDFSRDFPQASVHRLELNYRSTRNILDAANRVVANNINRLGKTLRTENEAGERPRFGLFEDGEEEARFVAEDIAKRGLAPESVAVFYRTNAQSRLLEESLRRRNLNYVVVGSIRFYSRKEVKDLLAYLRLLVNPRDDESLRRIINVPARGVGATTQERLFEYAALRRMPVFDVLREIELDETLPQRARNAVMQLVALIDELSLRAREAPVAEVLEELMERVNYRGFIQQSDEKEMRDRLAIVDEFLSACAEHDKDNGTPLAEFLSDLALSSDVDEWDASAPAVTLMTCHCAKGLEFENVYVTGLEEGLFPVLRGDEGDEDIEEERRLCYVAMTRARKTLTLTAARERMVFGRTDWGREISRFVREVGQEHLQPVAGQEPKREEGRAPGTPRRARRGEGAEGAQGADSAPAPLKSGTRVRHATFGSGTVIHVSSTGGKIKARVRFDTGKVAMLMIGLAPLEILEGKHRDPR
ncbi:MAG TPA: UvrD-helicase domain-containing protein [Candidatus Hydrogenedentes bacterium]|nr:UvrD-helicase domain-containing protein [Candidatus Hydrogenedentota bacterium]HOC72162.1 UvrD-helicase domain-containing protein [Candidatus Hydrogenedentota bacterium]HQL94813.1 UvrD-helicase domain-containing protein [Candidatus Hydrogenedentota bacterium]